MASSFSLSDNSTPTANAGSERPNADPVTASKACAGFFNELAEMLGDTADFADTDSMSDELRESRECDARLLAWAAKKPAMDAGLIPYEPRPARKTRNVTDTVRVVADRMCADGELMRLFDIPKQYPVGASVVRGWWSHHKIGGEVLFDGTNSLVLFYRAEIEAALKTWKRGTHAQCEFELDDDVPARIASAATDFRTDVNPLNGGAVQDDEPVAADSEGRSRRCSHGVGSHGCGSILPAPRAGKERRARGATLTNQEVA